MILFGNIKLRYSFVYLFTGLGDHGVPVHHILVAVRTHRSVRNPRTFRAGDAILGGDSCPAGEDVRRVESNYLCRDRMVQDLCAPGATATTV
jgi:hypothetical protein